MADVPELLEQWGFGDLVEVFDVKEAITWMKHNEEPKAMLFEYMANTCKQRYNWIKTDSPTTAEILEVYPRLLDPGIVEQDFRLAISEETNQLYAKWPSFSKQVYKYNSKVLGINWEKQLDVGEIDFGNLTEEECQELAFSVLPLLFVGRSKGMKGRCTPAESLRSFIDMKPEGTDIQNYMASIPAKERPQPFILLLGGSRFSPQQVFMVVERRAVLCSSILQAVDICMKIIYVLDLDYQPHCSAVWHMLQHMVYMLPPGSLAGVSLITFRTWLRHLPEA
ncbi:uncharacterized protein LOC117305821 isoform X1 [Asterias rubens]|uniref:uncharacterized protein LOC117289269 isoform X1 n=1 Tax=Asterias rubens TaxID=7604 RepID=UPI001455A1A9|nr:uncharacterized protein LOC117289269 isoform X1 [Asterias rubens]XP_033635165.1 uncharacterized protein LOC117296386 isoform X1 [Asterias rubens]XP_033643544.1 uncharacterized protein LOC117303454 isoform X1 [Asterias rubens]XP_033646583.1 uncharacterized protein LOC117305821 isoform X1 [Asterias rubens]